MTEMMKAYEEKTGKVMGILMQVFDNPDGYSKEEVVNMTYELFFYCLHLESLLTPHDSIQLPEESGMYVCSTMVYPAPKEVVFGLDVVYYDASTKKWDFTPFGGILQWYGLPLPEVAI